MKSNDSAINWDVVNERTIPIENEIQKTTQNILILSQQIATLEENEMAITQHVPRKEDLIAALTKLLDSEYDVLDQQYKVKAMKDLNLVTYVPKVRKTRKTKANTALNEFNSMLEAFHKKVSEK